MDMPRENQIFLHLLKTASNDVEYRIFLSFHNALLQGTVDLGIGIGVAAAPMACQAAIWVSALMTRSFTPFRSSCP